MQGVSERDWKLFKERLPLWQERHMKHLNEEYIKILSGEKSEAEKFWTLEKRINKDKHSSGVIADVRRANFDMIILELVSHKIITMSELEEFSDSVKEQVQRTLDSYKYF